MISLTDRLDTDFAPGWRPDPGDKLIGEVVSVTERTGDFGPYPVVTVRCDTGDELALHAFHTVAAAKLAEQAPRAGERIGIKYKGKRDGRYHDYSVVVERAAVPVDWSRYAEPSSTTGEPDKPEDPPLAAEAADDVPF